MSELTQRQPRMVDPGYLTFLRQQPCCLCGRRDQIEAAHIRIGLFAMQRKPDDKYAVPLCAPHHRTGAGGVLAQHSMGEERFWKLNSLDPFEIAARFYKLYGGDGGRPLRKRTTIKPKLPGRKIPSRPFPKQHRSLRT